MKFKNVSNWSSRTFRDTIVYSPNPTIFELLSNQPTLCDKEFWAKLYIPFACVIVSTIQNEIILVRDHVGLEPFYYSIRNNQLFFGSNIPDILEQMIKNGISIVRNEQRIIESLLDISLYECNKYTDETYYNNVYRVEPGYLIQISNIESNYDCKKTCFWQLDKHASIIQYKNNDDYLEQFSSLLDEAVTSQINSNQIIAAEYSGGLDSTAVIAAAHRNNIHPELFMHVPPSNMDETREIKAGKSVIAQFNLKANFIDATGFDFIETLHRCAKYFAGAPPFAFFMFAGNIHQAVANRGHTNLLSGFGGDQCVSGHVPLQLCILQLYRVQQYKLAWEELHYHYHIQGTIPPVLLKKLVYFFRMTHPNLSNKLSQLRSIGDSFITYLKQKPFQPPTLIKQNLPKNSFKNYNSLRDFEFSTTHGKEVRMRIEYSAVLGKALGFQYHYPLLYPKLVDFCFRLPLEQKRRHGVSRYLMRKYLAKSLGRDLYDLHPKVGSGSIMPATVAQVSDLYKHGAFDNMFQNLPYQHEIDYIIQNLKPDHPLHNEQWRFKINDYMFKYYWQEMNMTN